MDSLEIDGKQYLSAKRAAKEHSYAQDYIGQLIRGGKIVGRKVGRSWYVEEDSLNAYLRGNSSSRSDATYSSADTAPAEVESGTPEVETGANPAEFAETTESGPLQLQTQQTDMQEAPAAQVAPVPETGSYELLTYVSEDEPSFPELKEKERSFDDATIAISHPHADIEAPSVDIPVRLAHVSQERSSVQKDADSDLLGSRGGREGSRLLNARAARAMPAHTGSILAGLFAAAASLIFAGLVAGAALSLERVIISDGRTTSASVGISNIRDILK